MKILHIYKDYYPVLGGIENHIKMLAEYESSKGYDVTVLVTNNSNKTVTESLNGVKIIKASRIATVASTPLSISMLAILKKLKPQTVHLHFPYPLGETFYLISGIKAKTVITYHSDIVRQKYIAMLYRPLLERVLNKADRLIATSENYITKSPFLSRFRDKCAVIPLGIDLAPFENINTKQQAAIRTRYGTPLLLFVGKLRYYKGLPVLIEAMKEINASLLIVGTGPMETELKEMVKRLQLEEKVFFTGEVSYENLPDYFHACDIFVLPSTEKSEAFGTVLLEAMACAKPLISTELGTGTSFVNIDDVTGFVVKAKNPDAISSAATKILNNPELMKKFGDNAKKRVVDNFTISVMSDRILSLYHSI